MVPHSLSWEPNVTNSLTVLTQKTGMVQPFLRVITRQKNTFGRIFDVAETNKWMKMWFL